MKKMFSLVAVMAVATGPVFAGEGSAVTGDYVEARTAEVFTGGCIMGSEAETVGRQAVMAWRVAEGAHDGVVLDGLSVVAAVVGNRNLGIAEIGGVAPSEVRAAIMVDARADAEQQEALVSLARSLSNGLVDHVVDVRAVPIAFERSDEEVVVVAGDATLSVSTEMVHDPDCGAMQWFHPLASGTDAAMGVTRSQVYSGQVLGARWWQSDKKSSFYGTFS